MTTSAASPRLRQAQRPVALVASALTALLGAWLVVAHWVLSFSVDDPTANDVICGIVLLACALIQATGFLRRELGIVVAVVGLWLLIASVILYTSTAAWVNDLLCGMAAIALGLLSARLR